MSMQDFPTQAILHLWFEQALEQPDHIHKVKGRWFASNPVFDAHLQDSYEALLRPTAVATDWQGSANERLARILLLDQFSRNIYRGTAQAFVYDAAARILMRDGLEQQQDSELPAIGCSFFYMPLQHAEDAHLQAEAIRRYASLVSRARCDEERSTLESNLRFAHLHADIIERFGRFPHRNAVLGRESTPAEAAYLNDKAPRFGQ